jgi:RNA polymerase sigma factor (sigma-70 family)
MAANEPTTIPPFFANIVEKLYLQCWTVARAVVYGPCKEDANFKDIYQDAWFIVLTNYLNGKISTLQGCPYIAQIAKFACINMYRTRQKVYEAEGVRANLTMSPEEFGWVQELMKHYGEQFDKIRERYGLPEPPDHKPSAQEVKALLEVKNDVEQLNDKDWRMLSLKYYYNFSDPEIAEALGVTVGYVQVALSRYRKRLKSLQHHES